MEARGKEGEGREKTPQGFCNGILVTRKEGNKGGRKEKREDHSVRFAMKLRQGIDPLWFSRSSSR
jgi:hypothetical protein